MTKKSNYKENVGKRSAYHHISEGGLSFQIGKSTFVSDGQIKKVTPVFDLKINHYGVQTNHIKMDMSPKSLRKLGEWLIDESKNSEKWIKGSSYISSELELSDEVSQTSSESEDSLNEEEDKKAE